MQNMAHILPDNAQPAVHIAVVAVLKEYNPGTLQPDPAKAGRHPAQQSRMLKSAPQTGHVDRIRNTRPPRRIPAVNVALNGIRDDQIGTYLPDQPPIGTQQSQIPDGIQPTPVDPGLDHMTAY